MNETASVATLIRDINGYLEPATVEVDLDAIETHLGRIADIAQVIEADRDRRRSDMQQLASILRGLARLADPEGDVKSPSDFPEAGAASILKELKTMSDNLEAELTKLREDVSAQGTVIASATAAFEGLAAALLTAEKSATDKGASPDQIAQITSLRQNLEANTASLAAAIPQNTPTASDPSPATATVAPVPPATAPSFAAPAAPPDAAPTALVVQTASDAAASPPVAST